MSDVIRVKCKSCLATIKAKPKYQGKRVKCPGCGEGLQIPAGPDLSAPELKEPRLAPLSPEPKPAAVSPVIVDEPTYLDDSAFETVPEDDYGFVDANLDEYEDYGAPLPAPRPRPKPKRTRPKKRRRSSSSGGDGMFSINGGILGGIAMMVIAAVWFFGGLAAGIIFFYPPVLFIVGIAAFFKGLMGD